MALGAAFMVAGRLASRGISVISTLLLVRLLVPQDFGLVALAGAVVTMADTLTSTGYATVLVRRPAVERSVYDTAFTLNLLRCLLLAGLLSASADWQAGLLGDARIGSLLQVIALNIALDGLISVGLIRLQRDLRFDLLFRQQLASRLVSFLVTLGLAWATHSYFCLVLGNLVAKVLLLPYSYWLAPYRPRLSLAHWRELLGFSKWMFLQNLCTVADGQAANLVLGRAVGIQAVGTFNVAYQVAATPVTELAAPVRGPIYAGYARVQHDRALLRAQFIDGFGLLLALLLPLSTGIALVAPEIERIGLGQAWPGAATVVAFCALYALADSFAHFTGSIFAVLDHQPRLTAIFACMVAIRLPAIILAAMQAGLVGVAATLLATGLLNLLVWNWQAARLLGLRFAEYRAWCWRSLAAAATMTAAVLAARMLLPGLAAAEGSLAEAAWRLACLAALGAAVHVGTQGLLWRLSGAPAGSAEARIAAATAAGWRRLRARLAAPAAGRLGSGPVRGLVTDRLERPRG
ncbi:oligosaccharide flippase family protein [Paracraurococcus lichenis]|uniref:Oligosaccharide flippase family protein n=1 Tax=Paracraurococcus lichenis TaxID=3064888 RepID=A0ABT9EA75_9PROT|nr:oligosaccharide flippase family protein [Paracraurococcus sp. LOR1-02]MDO9713102.1 oligosaccharide flippase family protein [Paracraurococcus sp. LOR1-02]